MKPRIKINHHLFGSEFFDTTYFVMDAEQFKTLTGLKVGVDIVYLASIDNTKKAFLNAEDGLKMLSAGMVLFPSH